MNKYLKILSATALSLCLFCLAGCNSKDKLDKSDPVHIAIELTDGRSIKADLYPHIAPKTVENFTKLINENFYDGLIFHRVIDGFMIQGGGYDESFYDGNLNQKEADSIKGEFTQNGFTNNLKHTKGVLSMARTQDPDSASSQFFIMHSDYPSLDEQYAAFGEITDTAESMQVVDSIATAPTTEVYGTLNYNGYEMEQTMEDVPETPVVIKTIKIIE